MSGPLRLTSDEMRNIADALDAFTKIRKELGVDLAGYGNAEIRHVESDVVLAVSWSDDEGYSIDDRSGS